MRPNGGSSDSLDEAILRGGSASSEVEMMASDKDSPGATPRFVQTLPTIPSSGNLSAGVAAKVKPLSLLPLIALIFYDVSGGPFGIEDAVSAGAPLLAVIGFIVLPIIWSVPEALVTAELATTFPENSGYVAWVTAAFGPFWGFQEGFWKWLSGVTDNSVYPVMFLSYLTQVVKWDALTNTDSWVRVVFLVGLNLALTYLNYRGLHIVGNVAIATAVFTLLPFAVIAGLGLPHVNPANWVQVDWAAVDWVPFLNVMFWNLNYWDSVSTLAGEVQDPSRTFPRALGGAVVLVVLSYLIPLLVGLGVTTQTDDWKLGYFAAVADHVGGKWLAWWVVAAAAVSQIGQFEAEMSSDSYQLQGMAERGFIPAAFNKRSKYGTPTLAVICSSLGVATMASFNFLQIVELLNMIYCMAELLEFVAFIWLRVKYPSLHRPYRIPLPTWGCCVMLAPACLLLVTMLVLPLAQGEFSVLGWTLGAGALGCVLYPLLQLARRRQWVPFEGCVHEFKESLYTMYVPGSGPPSPLAGMRSGGLDSERLLSGALSGGPFSAAPSQQQLQPEPCPHEDLEGGGWAHVMAGPGQQLYRRPSSQSSQHGASPR